MTLKNIKKTLVIAEKPSVAQDIAKALGDKFTREKTHFSGDQYIISYAVGHLVTLCEPAEMDDKYKSWKMDCLPILPEKFLLKPIPSSKAQLSALIKLIKSRDVGTIINACDAGREGELIFRYIMEYADPEQKLKKPLFRLWLQSMTTDSIRKAFNELRNDKEMLDLASAASCRSEADWLIGINASRGFTAYNSKDGGFFISPSGRVQTPTLSMIVDREKERLDFQTQTYYKIKGVFEQNGKKYEGHWFNPKAENDANQSTNRIWDFDQAQSILNKIKDKKGTVTELTKPASKSPQPLFDLTSLQREANNRFGYSAKRTLNIAQSLYEKYKVLTYPRTDSRFLPEDYIVGTKETLKKLKPSAIGIHATKVLENEWVKPNKKIFNNAKISDHHAIIPTGVISNDLPEAEAKIFFLVLQRFVAIFFPNAEFSNTTRITSIDSEVFKTEGKVLIRPGFLEVYGRSEQEDDQLDPIQLNELVKLYESLLETAQTKAPPRYNESTLLSAMEGAGKFVEDGEIAEALKERGLGTPATRASVIEKLIADHYLIRDGKELSPTRKAFDLLSLISAMGIEDLKSPELTGEWEKKLGDMEKSLISKEEFIDKIKTLTISIVDKIKNFDESANRSVANFSPIDGKVIYEYIGYFAAEDDSFRIRKILGGRHMSSEEIHQLIEHNQIGPLDGFVSKKGMPFTASIQLKNGKVEFMFDNPESEKFDDLDDTSIIGHSFIDQSPVYLTPTCYISKSAIDGEKTGVRLNLSILGKSLEIPQVQKLIQGEKTDLITGFRSSKTKRLFDAYLQLSKAGKISFSFPPRKSSGKKNDAEANESL
jgi:DNA topoisomerase III